MKPKRVRIEIDGARKSDAGYHGGTIMLTTRMTNVVAPAAVVGASAWCLQSSSQIDVMIKTEPTTITTTAPKTILEPIPSTSPQEVADVIDGYDDMLPRAEKMEAIRTLLGKTKDRAVFALLNKEYMRLVNDLGENANKKFEGVAPNGWATDTQ